MGEMIRITDYNQSGFRPYILPSVYYEMNTISCVKLGYVMDGYACGAIVVNVERTLAKLRSLFVDEEVRNRGIGTVLVEGAIRELKSIAVTWLEVGYCLSDEEHGAMAKVLMNNGFPKPELRSLVYELRLGEVLKRPLFQRIAKQKPYENSQIVPLNELTDEQCEQYFRSSGCPRYLDWRKMDYYKPISVGLIRDGQLHGAAIGSRTGRGIYLDGVCFSTGRGIEALYLLYHAILGCLRYFDADTIVTTNLLNGHSKNMYRHLVGDESTIASMKEYSTELELAVEE